jgi:uncharacterized membrane protein YfcA
VTAFEIAVLLLASAGAGAMNAMAGGGTILTYPSLVFLGLDPIRANATSTVALWPGAAASLAGYKEDVRRYKDWLLRLMLPSLAGGTLGAVLLLRTPAKTFGDLAPFLILFATGLFLLQGILSRPTGRASPGEDGPVGGGRLAAAVLLQFATSVYGGYFGAGMGILMLAILGFLGIPDIHAANGLKNFFGMCINGVAALYFIWRGAVVWPFALVMIVGAIAGGYGGARFARWIGKERARAAVVVIGLAVAAALLIARARA